VCVYIIYVLKFRGVSESLYNPQNNVDTNIPTLLIYIL